MEGEHMPAVLVKVDVALSRDVASDSYEFKRELVPHLERVGWSTVELVPDRAYMRPAKALGSIQRTGIAVWVPEPEAINALARRVHADGVPWRGTVVYSPYSDSLTFRYEPAYRWHGRKVAASFRVEGKRSAPFWYIATWSDDDFSAYL
ncbi:MAG: hypothetical protein ACE5LB_15195, partial [Acidiferrobacterales bacterium]